MIKMPETQPAQLYILAGQNTRRHTCTPIGHSTHHSMTTAVNCHHHHHHLGAHL